MNSSSMEWVARVAARNEIEEAKALRGLLAVPLSAGAVIKHRDTEAQREVAR